MLLAHLSVRVGIEVLEADRTPRRMPAFDATYQQPLPIAKAVDAFNASNQDYVATVLEEVVVIRPRTDRVNYLDEPLVIKDPVITGASAALRRVFSALNPALGRGGAIVGSRPVDPVAAGDYVTITLTPGRSVILSP